MVSLGPWKQIEGQVQGSFLWGAISGAVNKLFPRAWALTTELCCLQPETVKGVGGVVQVINQ